MVVAGAPEICPDHSARILDMALDMINAVVDLRDPSTGGSMKIRIGNVIVLILLKDSEKIILFLAEVINSKVTFFRISYFSRIFYRIK